MSLCGTTMRPHRPIEQSPAQLEDEDVGDDRRSRVPITAAAAGLRTEGDLGLMKALARVKRAPRSTD